MKFLCDNCKAKYQIADEKVAGKTVRMKCRRCGHNIVISSRVTEGSVSRQMPMPDESTDGAAADTAPASGPFAASEPTFAPHQEQYSLSDPGGRPTPAGSAPERGVPVPRLRQAPAPPAPRAKPPRPDIDRPQLDDESTVIMTPAMRAVPPPSPSSPHAAPAPKPPVAPTPSPPRAGIGGAPRPQAPLRSTPTPPAAAARAPQTGGLGGGGPFGTRQMPATSPAAVSSLAARAPARPMSRALPQDEPANDAAPKDEARGMAAAFNRAVVDQPASSGPQSKPAAAGDDWYVGVGGVPLGPIPLSAIRDKAHAGLVELESLVWREGFDEWLPLKKFPELVEVVRAAQAARQRVSAATRKSAPPADPFADMVESPLAAVAAAMEQRASVIPAPTPSPAPVAAVANGAAALSADKPLTPAKIEAPLGVLADPFAAPGPVTSPTPFAPPAAAEPHKTNGAGAVSLIALTPPVPQVSLADDLSVDALGRRRRGMHPMAYAFIAMAAVFGGVAAWVLLSKPPPVAQPQIVVVQAPAPTPTTSAAAAPTDQPTGEVAVLDPTVAPGQPRPTGGLPRGDSKSATSSAPVDTSGFQHNTPGPTNTDSQGSGGLSGSSLSAGEINGVVASNQPRVKRKCWQPALDAKSANAPSSARVNASVTISPSGNVDSVSASGSERDYPTLASCIASSIKSWKFPPSGAPTTVNIPFVFAGQ